jgi:hypothetical protein
MRWCEAGHHIVWSYTAPCKEHAVAPEVEPERDENSLVEPRAVTGAGPQGRRSGPGRFHLPDELTALDRKRIEAYVRWREYLATHGGGEK